MDVIIQLQARQVFAQKKIIFVAVFLTLPILLSLAVALAGGFEEKYLIEAAGVFLFLLYPQCFCLLIALLYGSGLLSSELEEKTLTYLFTRPLPKWKFIVGKYIAVIACLSVFSCVSLLLSWLFLGAPGGGEFILGMAVSVVAALATYTALFTAIGTIFYRKPMIIGFLYGAIETLLSFIPALVSKGTVTFFLRSLATRIINPSLNKDLELVIGDVPLWESSLTLVVMISAALLVSCVISTFREYNLAEEA